MLRLLHDTNFHIGLAVAFVVCGATYKYWIRPRHQIGIDHDWPELAETELDDELDADEMWAEDAENEQADQGDGEEEWQRYDDFFNNVPVEGDGGIARPPNHLDINPPPSLAQGATRSSGSIRNRNVGAKKAKSLARRDRVRAYNEYIRQQGDAERYAQKEFEEKYGDLIEQAREERAAREEAAGQKLREQKEKQREKERAQKERKQRLRDEMTAQLEENGKVRLSNEEEAQIASTITDGTIVAGGTWLIHLDHAQITQLAGTIRSKGKASFSELVDLLRES